MSDCIASISVGLKSLREAAQEQRRADPVDASNVDRGLIVDYFLLGVEVRHSAALRHRS